MYTDIEEVVHEYTKMATKLFVDICILARCVMLKYSIGERYNMHIVEQY